jgi:ribose-phosphate pyrophosphokinase
VTKGPLLIPLPGNRAFARAVAAALPAQVGRAAFRRFPDGESLVRVVCDVRDRDVAFVASLVHPDTKLVRLTLAAGTARDLGARSVGLIAPYLAYLRQDAQFRPGEGVSARHVAALLSGTFDWLVTVDPHLHRISALTDVFAIPAQAVDSAPALAAWVRDNVASPVVVSPDEEGGPRAEAVAKAAGAPHLVLRKTRHGDHHVEIAAKGLRGLRRRTPVLVDDIVSTAGTMAESAVLLRHEGLGEPVCLAVHALFVRGATERLRAAGVGRVVSCNTVRHPTNAIDVAPLVAAAAGDGVRNLGHSLGKR